MNTIEHLVNYHGKDILRFVVVREEGEAYKGVLCTEMGDFYHLVDEREKILAEIDHWIDALSQGEPLKNVSQGLYEMRLEGKTALARTLRLLLYFKALFSKVHDGKNEKYLEDKLKGSAQYIVEGCADLAKALDKLTEIHLDLEGEPNVKVSMGLLLVMSLALSQIEFFRPVFWEAYSAARAREELDSRLPNLPKSVVDLVTLFIRYQSSPGQYARFTGDVSFTDQCRKYEDSFELGKNSILNTLNLIGVVHEARNHMLPGNDKTWVINNLPVNADVDRKWGEATCFLLSRDDIKKYSLASLFKIYRNKDHLEDDLRLRHSHWGGHLIAVIIGRSEFNLIRHAKAIFSAEEIYEIKDYPGPDKPSIKRPTYTWGFTTAFNIKPDDLNRFKDTVEKITEEEEIKKESRYHSISFTFGRDQAKDLRDFIPKYIEKVRNESDFLKFFDFRKIDVPNCFDASANKELVIEVRLRDVIAAELLLFNDCKENDGQQNPLPEESAESLFCHLFRRAKEDFQLEKLALHKGQKFYFPFPLLRRLLNTVYRLRPETCLCLPITYKGVDDSLSQEIISIPKDLCPKCNEDEISLISHYVHAMVLNQGVSRGFLGCELGLGELDGNINGRCRNGHDLMTPEAWKERINEACQENCYALLEEKYLRDYYSAHTNVQSLPFLRPSPLTPPGIAATSKELKTYFEPRNEEPYSLGIDIGGTNIKIHFYTFDFIHADGRSAFKEESESFRLSTAMPVSNAKKEPIGEWLRSLIDQMVLFLENSEFLKSHQQKPSDKKPRKLLGIGISWPGPVRYNLVAGTSGILRNFPPLTGKIVENQIQDIMNLEVAGNFQKIWREKCSSKGDVFRWLADVTSVRLINDGDADGMGAVDYFQKDPELQKNSKKEEDKNQKLVVIKIGTGTAGAVFTGGRIEPGLNEWGKILLDIHAPAAASVGQDFPQGVANPYLSQNTMANLITKYMHEIDRFFQVEKLNPKELDLILTLSQQIPDPNSRCGFDNFTRELRQECGLRDLAALPNLEFDAELIRWVRKQTESESVLKGRFFAPIGKYYRAQDKQAMERLDEEIEKRGTWRIATLLDLPDNADDPAKFEKLKGAGKFVESLAEKFGYYLGDLIALLYDLYQMNEVVLGGGILSGKIGDQAIKIARERVLLYGIGNLKIEKPNPPEGGKIFNLGTLGAAVHAATGFLQDLKEQGLIKLEQVLMRLGPNGTATIGSHEISFEPNGKNTIELLEYALTPKDVENYFKKYAADLGYYRSGPAKYTRWSMQVVRRRK